MARCTSGNSPPRLRPRNRPSLTVCTAHYNELVPHHQTSPVLSTAARWQPTPSSLAMGPASARSEEHTSELQSRGHLVCRLLLEKKTYKNHIGHRQYDR